MLKICDQVIFNNLKVDAALKSLQDIFSNNQSGSASKLLDVLCVIDTQLEALGNKEEKERFKELCRNCCSQNLIPDDVLNAMVDSFNDETFNSRYVKTKTRLFYKQLKFNLLREESEGYAKLITELSQDISGLANFNSDIALLHIRSLIGQFNLDPNRVLDIILECFECRPEETQFFLSLLDSYKANSDDICNLLGFKFTFYRKKNEGIDAGSSENAPMALYKIAAQLLRKKMIDLLNLCSYLYPNLDVIMAHIKRISERASAAEKRAGQLASSQVGNAQIEDIVDKDSRSNSALMLDRILEGDDDIDLVHNQKLSLLLALLELGDWPHAKQMLDRLPEFYAVRFPEIAKALCALVQARLDGFYSKCLKRYCIMPECTPRPGVSLKIDIPVVKTQAHWFCSSDIVDASMPIKQIDSYLELVNEVFPLLHYLGCHVAHDSVLLVRVIRLCVAYMSEKATRPQSELDGLFGPVVDLCDEVLLPALSMMGGNCAVGEELWSLMTYFSYQTRYRLYGRWKAIQIPRHPELRVLKAEAIAKTKYIMKRLSKETIKQAGRHLSKLCHSYPHVVFDYIFTQLQQFENLVGPVVESLRFLTNLGYDVLAYAVIEELSNPVREKMKVSGIALSDWLQSMATFVGAVFKKYSIELTGVLQYVANQLKAGKSYDLLVLREVVQNMSGIETTEQLTKEQLEALAGGDLLRQEGGSLSVIRNTKRSSNRLREALLQEDLVVCLCILTAQQRDSIVFKEGIGLPLKLVGQMLDQCQETLVQFGSFLSANLKGDDYARRMPSVGQLIQEYKLGVDAAFFLARPVYAHLTAVKYDELKKPDKLAKVLTSERKTQHYISACDFVTEKLESDMRTVFPESFWSEFTPEFYATFWMLSMYDLYVPDSSYDREMEKMRKCAQVADSSSDLSESKRRKERERFSQCEAKLGEEQRRQDEHVERVLSRLRRKNTQFFQSRSNHNFLFQHCFLPRLLFSDLDALYCAKFLFTLHKLNTPNFSTLHILMRIMTDMFPLLSIFSEKEANHFGRFLCGILEQVTSWRENAEKYNNECRGKYGFDNQVQAVADLNHQFYLTICHKWEIRMSKAFLAAIDNKNYVIIRNALLVMMKILPYFPVIDRTYSVLDKHVNNVKEQEKESRQDLHVLAISYLAHLKQRKDVKILTEYQMKGQKEPPKKPVGRKVVVNSAEMNATSVADASVSSDKTSEVQILKVTTTPNVVKTSPDNSVQVISGTTKQVPTKIVNAVSTAAANAVKNSNVSAIATGGTVVGNKLQRPKVAPVSSPIARNVAAASSTVKKEAVAVSGSSSQSENSVASSSPATDPLTSLNNSIKERKSHASTGTGTTLVQPSTSASHNVKTSRAASDVVATSLIRNIKASNIVNSSNAALLSTVSSNGPSHPKRLKVEPGEAESKHKLTSNTADAVVGGNTSAIKRVAVSTSVVKEGSQSDVTPPKRSKRSGVSHDGAVITAVDSTQKSSPSSRSEKEQLHRSVSRDHDANKSQNAAASHSSYVKDANRGPSVDKHDTKSRHSSVEKNPSSEILKARKSDGLADDSRIMNTRSNISSRQERSSIDKTSTKKRSRDK